MSAGSTGLAGLGLAAAGEPRADEPVVCPGNLAMREWEALVASELGELIAVELANEIVDGACKLVYDMVIRENAVPYALQLMTQQMVDAVEVRWGLRCALLPVAETLLGGVLVAWRDLFGGVLL